MNHLITDQLPPPPVPFQPPRSSFTCDRHHNDTFTGFCPSCLSERLTISDQPSTPTTTTTTAADLRRTKSLSVSNTQHLPIFERQRKSCDVNTHSTLFAIDDTNLNDLEDEIVEMEAKIDQIVDNLMSFNLDSKSKKSSFWSTASKKWNKWRKKSNSNAVVLSTRLPVNNHRETQSEVADYGYGRRSCDINTGRVSFHNPRSSWDGYTIGRSFPRLNINPIQRSDMQIPVEEPVNLPDFLPGGSTQTREFYSDSSSSSRRRKTVDRTEVSNSKVSPGIMDYNYRNSRSRFHSIGGENELGTNCGLETLNNDTTKIWRRWSWMGLRFVNGKPTRNEDNVKLSRSSTSVSMRNAESNSIEKNGKNRGIGDEFVFDRNSSANHVNEGVLRFYLTPLRGSGSGSGRRHGSGTGTGKSRLF